MSDLLDACRKLLKTAAIELDAFAIDNRDAAAIEGRSVFGFVVVYPSASVLIDRWKRDTDAVLRRSRQQLTSSLGKSSNGYLILLAEAEPDYGQRLLLAAIEEDLVATRKIARAGVTAENLHSVLLPLLPLQNAPRLTAVDMREEISLRTTELPKELVDAFLGSNGAESLVRMAEELE
jgi:hypothetical protein